MSKGLKHLQKVIEAKIKASEQSNPEIEVNTPENEESAVNAKKYSKKQLLDELTKDFKDIFKEDSEHEFVGFTQNIPPSTTAAMIKKFPLFIRINLKSK